MVLFALILRFALLWLIGGLATILVYCFVREGRACHKFVEKQSSENTYAMIEKYFEVRGKVLDDNIVYKAMSGASDDLKKSDPLRYVLSFILGLCVWPNRVMICKDLYDYIEEEVLNRS